MSDAVSPLLTLEVHEKLIAAQAAQVSSIECSLDLGRSLALVEPRAGSWEWQGHAFPYLERCKDRTIYYWNGEQFAPAARYTDALIKLVPTQWGAPTFEIDGIKMLPTAHVSPYEDARSKVESIEPRGKRILDTCGGLGYFARWCLAGGAAQVVSYEKNSSVLWLRSLNPWSPEREGGALERLRLIEGDIQVAIAEIQTESFDAVLHDPPRFGIAGELYSLAFYEQLARVLKPNGKLFHYTGTPNRLTSGRDVPNEVARRLQHAGFRTRLEGDGILAHRKK